MDLQNYPFLTAEEFAEACHHIDSRYRQATLGPLRKEWKLRVCTALDMKFSLNSGYTTYLQIIRPLETNADVDLDLSNFSISTCQEDDLASTDTDNSDMMDAEDADKAAILSHASQNTAHVTYEVHLHPSYRVPCLWFSIHGLPPHEPSFNIDTVFRRLIPDQYKSGLRKVSGIGGISADVSCICGYYFASRFPAPSNAFLSASSCNWGSCILRSPLPTWRCHVEL